MTVCPDTTSLLDFEQACVRTLWSLISLATTLVIVLCIAASKSALTRKPLRIAFAPFSPFLSVSQAEAYEHDDSPLPDTETVRAPRWRTFTLTAFAFAETIAWMLVGTVAAVQHASPLAVARAYVTSGAWLYATVRPVAKPVLTAPYDLFALLLAQAAGVTLYLGGDFYERTVYDEPLRLEVLATYLADVAIVISLLTVIVNIPMGTPSPRIDKAAIGDTISPEDYATLWQWGTFKWVWPLIKKGMNTTLNEDDVWTLSPTFRSRPLLAQFALTIRSTLLRRILAANSFDFLMDGLGAYVSIAARYVSPYCLRRILKALDDPTPENRSQAYAFAFLAFVSELIRVQADLQHLWFGRRAATRIQSELMVSLYDKALRRKYLIGATDSKKTEESSDDKLKSTDSAQTGARKADTGKDKKDTAEDKGGKTGADVAKIVNMMSGDVSSIGFMISIAFFLHGSPVELLVASVFLYQLLGWSAFAGFFMLVAAWPVNSFLAKRGTRIHKGFKAACDDRMSVLNELIGGVKFVKFFAWEHLWIDRVLDARAIEIKWLTKSRLNRIFLSSLWALVPIFMPAVSFAVYVYLGNELTVSTAFTSIAVFQMIRGPLNLYPGLIVSLFQTMVSINRIGAFLGEDEVDGQVSSLKSLSPRVHHGDDEDDMYDRFGIEQGTFIWNETAKGGERAKAGDGKSNGTPNNTDSDAESLLAHAPLTSVELERRFELRDISIIFPEEKITIVTGPTASGKTALLMALLGELTTTHGRIMMRKDFTRVEPNGVRHTISYAAQTPWLRHQSIKENILFGCPLDEVRYKKVIEACALQLDFDILEDGDETEIGARGVNLSGGQKARVALARAIYSPSKYILLDDPLSAIDSQTARFLFENVLCGELLLGRTVILVTHHVELVLPGAHYLVRMLDGRIDTQGTIADLRATGVLDDIKHEEEAIVSENVQAIKENPSSEESAVLSDSEGREKGKNLHKLVQEEKRETGSVKWSVYKAYFQASSYWTWEVLAFLIGLVQVFAISEKVWIKFWGAAYSYADNSSLTHSRFLSQAVGYLDGGSTSTTFSHSVYNFSAATASNKLPSAQTHPFFYVGVYAAIGLASALASILSTAVLFTGAIKGSRRLFKQLLQSVVCATMRWHDTTPTGRMLNRFSHDVETIDLSLASTLQAVLMSAASVLASVLTIGFLFPIFLVPALVIGTVYYWLALAYLRTGRDLRRMESNLRSPIFSGFSELLDGIVTVRAFSAEKHLLDQTYTKIDATIKMEYNTWMTNRWLSLNFEFLGQIAVLITTLIAVSGFVSAGTAGISITSAMTFTSMVYWTCRMWTNLELDLNSVERIAEYLDLPSEPPANIEGSRFPKAWPSTTSNNLIVVDDLVVKYAPELPAVLHNVSFALKGGERVGLLGRTGSGKSTLAMSILRFVDPISGRILVDGVDITTIGLHDLRSRITFIPQDATLFSGTLRENLDPFNEHDDDECTKVLRRVHFFAEDIQSLPESSYQDSHAPTRSHSSSTSSPTTEAVAEASAASVTDVDSNKAPLTLDTRVSSGGSNFSQGQRQLIAIARALLRRSSIIILDEATSSIDFVTDAKIQKAIREEFGGALLLTVAHRLKTIIDYDRLIVLDKGVVAEFDTPWNLLQKDGIFRNMCTKSGMFEELMETAKARAGAL